MCSIWGWSLPAYTFPLYSPYTLQISQGAVSISVFKLYLGRILGSCDQHNEQAGLSGPLMLYHHQPRSQIGRVLMAAPDLGSPAPYIPTFYQEYATTANHTVRAYKILFFSLNCFSFSFLACISIYLSWWYSACNQTLCMNNLHSVATPSVLESFKVFRYTSVSILCTDSSLTLDFIVVNRAIGRWGGSGVLSEPPF